MADNWAFSERDALPPRDERARRLAGLALTFSEGGGPISSSRLRAAFYPDLAEDAFRKSFARDIEALASSGLAVENLAPRGEEGMWQAAEASFVADPPLTGDEAAILDLACVPLLNDPSFAWRDELRLALAKVDDHFAGSFPAPIAKRGGSDPLLSQLLDCETRRVAASVRYERADGTVTTRTIAPLGHFSLRGHIYFVAARLDGEGPEEPHVYLFDRFSRVSAVPGAGFEVPEGFDLRDYVKLPFQLGPCDHSCRLRVPETVAGDVREAIGHRGRTSVDGQGRTVWEVPAHDLTLTARWAIGNGLVPLAPQELVREWRRILEEAADAS